MPRSNPQLGDRRYLILSPTQLSGGFRAPSRSRAATSRQTILLPKARPPSLSAASTIDQIWEAYWYVPTDTVVFPRNLARITEHLTRTRGFPLTADDLASLTYVYEAFYRLGPGISFGGYRIMANEPTFATLTAGKDSAGNARSFLASEESFRFIRTLHTRNMIIPVVGDFAGPRAIRAVAGYLTEHGTTVNAFYISNVESYLFPRAGRAPMQQRFYANAATLPLDSSSIFIRPDGALFQGNLLISGGRVSVMQRQGEPRPVTPAATTSEQLAASHAARLCPMRSFLAAAVARRVPTFKEAMGCMR